MSDIQNLYMVASFNSCMLQAPIVTHIEWHGSKKAT